MPDSFPFSNKEMLSISKKHGTPVYAYDAQTIQKRCRELRTHFPGFSIFYACKANNSPELMKLIRKEGIGVEMVSPGEIRAAQAAGYSKKDLSFTCSNLSLEDLRVAAHDALELTFVDR